MLSFRIYTLNQVCADCFAGLRLRKVCPLARCDYDLPVRRNLVVEDIIADAILPVSCANAGFGCQAMVRGPQIQDHLSDCDFRKVPCPSTICDKIVRFADVKQHILVHNPVFLSSCKEIITFRVHNDWVNNDWAPIIHKVEGQKFYLQCVVRDKAVMVWLMVEGGRKEAAKWRTSIAIDGPMEVDITYTIDVVPIDISTADVIESGQFATMHYNLFKKYKGSSELSVRFVLFKK